MKNIQSIISNLSKQNSFKRLNTLGIINKLILTLPYNLRKSVLFSSLKGNTLLIAFNHPSSASEFNNYKVKIFLQSLEQIKISYNNPQDLAEIMPIKHAKGYIPRNILNTFDIVSSIQKDEKIIIECYKEHSSGNFSISSDNPFYDIFSKIQNTIKYNNESSH